MTVMQVVGLDVGSETTDVWQSCPVQVCYTSSRQRMPDKVTIRPAGASDTALLADLGRRTFVGAFGSNNEPSHMDEYVAWAFTPGQLERELADPAAQFLIAETDGVAVGYAKIREWTAPECVAGIRPVELERIYADQASIGTGIGSALMGACLDAIRARGGETVWLGVWERNERAIRFYEKWGFEIVGAKVFLLGGDKQTDVVMVRQV